MQLIEETIKRGKTAIMLVPEISLTPQMVDRFSARFGYENIAVMHSKLSQGERFDTWEKIKKGKVKIVIGARSAIFAPIQNLGIIEMDYINTTGNINSLNIDRFHITLFGKIILSYIKL